MHKILRFLTKLSENNNNAWFQINQGLFMETQGVFACEVMDIIKKMTTTDPRLLNVKVRQSMQRIQRDARYTKSMEEPFHNHFSICFSPLGKACDHAGYCIHMEPRNRSYVSGGIVIESAKLNRLVRNRIVKHPEEYEAIINDPIFKKVFPQIDSPKLLRFPHGYDHDADYADLIMPRNFMISSKIPDREFSKKSWQDLVAARLLLMKSFVDFIEKAIEEEA